VALAALRWFARKRGDTKVLQLTDQWWRREIALLSLVSVPSGTLRGRIVAPGGRTVYTPQIPESGGSVPRDVVYSMVMGLNANKKNDQWFRTVVEPRSFFEKKEDDQRPGPAKPSLDLAAPWIVRDLLKSGDDLGGARAAGKAALNGDRSNLPKLVDRLHVVRTSKGHVAWFDDMTKTKGEPPQFWAWCDYATGDQKYSREKPAPLPPEPPGGFAAGNRIEI
jgi:hypothetical protein